MGAQPKTPLIGQIAVHLKMITMDQLAEATAEQARRGDGVRLAELFIEKGLITLEQCAKLAAYQKQLVAKRRAQAAVAKVDSVAVAAPPAAPTARPRDSARLDEILRDAVARGASDIHIHAGSPLRLRVNGETKQDASTADMIFGVARLIAVLSLGMTLEPGDLMMTGTPSGVGFARQPPEYLQPGDVVEAEIDRIGLLRNVVAGE